MYILVRKEKIRLRLLPFTIVHSQMKEALPFFFTLSAGMIRQMSTATILGVFFTMADVALYDLAYKIISIPQAIFSNVSAALFPKVMKEYSVAYVKKLIRFQGWLGILTIAGIAAFGKYIVLLLGGPDMSLSYYFAVILSITVFTWLVVGGINSFLFVPAGLYYTITKNQLVAFVTYFTVCGIGILIFRNIFIVAIAMAAAGLGEIAYCLRTIKKHDLLRP